MKAIWLRELRAYFQSPIGYTFMGFFLLVAGLFFTVENLNQGSASFAQTLSSMSFIFMLLVPILTMRLMAEDRKAKTDQMLLTAPVSVWEVVWGKYLAAVCMLAATLLISLIFPIILARYAELSALEILCGYIGFFLLGCSFIAIGLLMSSLTENQVTAAAGSFALLLAIYLMDMLLTGINLPWLAAVLSWLSAYRRFQGFTSGILSFSAVMYFLSFSGLFVFLCVRSVERRRWS